MQNTPQPSIKRLPIKIGLLCLLISAAFGTGLACAQSGSTGGSIGNDEKSLSGSREAPRSVESSKPARRSKPEAEEPRRASRSGGGSGGGGGGSFDGVWATTSVGCGGTLSGAMVITSGRIIGDGFSGRVSSSGSASGTGSTQGMTWTSSGRLSGRSGSGSYRRADGCVGSWTASKQ